MLQPHMYGLHFIVCGLHIDTLLHLFRVLLTICLWFSSITASLILQPQVKPDRVIHLEDTAASYDTARHLFHRQQVKIAIYRETKQTQDGSQSTPGTRYERHSFCTRYQKEYHHAFWSYMTFICLCLDTINTI